MKKYFILLITISFAIQILSCASAKKKNASAASSQNSEDVTKKVRTKEEQQKTLTEAIEGTGTQRVKNDKGPVEKVRNQTEPRMLEKK